MRRALLYILFLVLAVPIGAVEVPCGTWIELRANSVDDWHFDHWSDGNTDAVRQVEVLGDAHYVAYFAPNCGDYPSLPVVALYDWLIMLDMRSIKAQGYYFDEAAVTWYRVRGVPDKLSDGASADDERVGTGYSLTLNRSFIGTGDYYASVDVSSSPSGVLCTDMMRSLIVHYASAAAPAPPLLEPTIVRPNEPQRLIQLDADHQTTVSIYDIAGRRLQTLTAYGVERLSLQAQPTVGCYQVVVENGEQRTVLRYIVTQ